MVKFYYIHQKPGLLWNESISILMDDKWSAGTAPIVLPSCCVPLPVLCGSPIASCGLLCLLGLYYQYLTAFTTATYCLVQLYKPIYLRLLFSFSFPPSPLGEILLITLIIMNYPLIRTIAILSIGS